MAESAGGFNPTDLLPEASLNRTVIPDADPFPREFRGVRGFDLLSSNALVAVSGASNAVEEAARRLAALLAALVRHTESSDGRGVDPTPWRLQYLRYWSTIEEVWVAGGTAERLGPDLGLATTEWLEHYGLKVVVARHPHAGALPLIGAARTIAGDHQTAAVLDFGHSWVKRGRAWFDARGALSSLDVLPPIPVDMAAASADDVTAFVDTAVRRTVADSGAVTATRCAVAAYVTRDGTVSDGRSHYAAIGGTQPPIGATFLHDGTAAASAIDTTRRAAVVTLGTALGVGFVTDNWRRPLGKRFVVRR